MEKQVRFEASGALGILTLANPPLNLFSEELIEDLRDAVTAAKQTPLRALMVRAEGKIFSGGADVRIFKGKTSALARERVTSHLRTIADLEELPCPTLAAVQGLGGIDRHHDAARRRSAPRRARRPEPCARNHLYRRAVRRDNLRTVEHRQPHCSR